MLVKKRQIWPIFYVETVLLTILASCASESVADNNAQLVAQQEGQVCLTKFQAAHNAQVSSLEFWKCADHAMLKMAAAIDPADIDIYQNAAAQNEVAAAEFDSGQITREEAASIFNANSAEANSTLKSREIAREHNN